MQGCRIASAIALILTLATAPADACGISVKRGLNDVVYADVVVVGRISNYRIVRDETFRRKMLANPKLSPDLRLLYEGPGSLLSDYARFDVEVDELLVGKTPKRFSVTWDNSTFGEPEEMPAGPFLIALRDPGSAMPPLRGPSATILPSPDPTTLTLLQAPCSRPFLLERGSLDAGAVRFILSARRP